MTKAIPSNTISHTIGTFKYNLMIHIYKEEYKIWLFKNLEILSEIQWSNLKFALQSVGF